MSERVSASITIGGPVPAGRLDELVKAILAEDLGPDWDERFDCATDVVHHLQRGAAGATLRAHQVKDGEFYKLQAFCIELGLTYVLTWGGAVGSFAAGRRIRRPGDAGHGQHCLMDGESGHAALTAEDIRYHGLDDRAALLAHLKAFDKPDIPPLELRGAVQ